MTSSSSFCHVLYITLCFITIVTSEVVFVKQYDTDDCSGNPAIIKAASDTDCSACDVLDECYYEWGLLSWVTCSCLDEMPNPVDEIPDDPKYIWSYTYDNEDCSDEEPAIWFAYTPECTSTTFLTVYQSFFECTYAEGLVLWICLAEACDIETCLPVGAISEGCAYSTLVNSYIKIDYCSSASSVIPSCLLIILAAIYALYNT